MYRHKSDKIMSFELHMMENTKHIIDIRKAQLKLIYLIWFLSSENDDQLYF